MRKQIYAAIGQLVWKASVRYHGDMSPSEMKRVEQACSNDLNEALRRASYLEIIKSRST